MITSADILARLRATRFASNDGWVAMEEVTPPKTQRRFDLIAVHAWQSGRREAHGVEIKVARGDWLREAADPEKSKPLLALCHRYWLCCPPEVCSKGEIPDTWGLLHVTDDQIRQTKAAPNLEPAPWGADIWRCMLLRCSTRTTTEAEIRLAELRGKTDAESRAAESERQRRSSNVYELEQLQKKVKDLEAATGINLDRWLGDKELARIGQVSAHLAAIPRDLHAKEIRALATQAETLSRQLSGAAQIAETLTEIGTT